VTGSEVTTINVGATVAFIDEWSYNIGVDHAIIDQENVIAILS
jgi:hypothetical protein